MTPFSVQALPCAASTFFREVTEPLVLAGEHRKGGTIPCDFANSGCACTDRV